MEWRQNRAPVRPHIDAMRAPSEDASAPETTRFATVVRAGGWPFLSLCLGQFATCAFEAGAALLARGQCLAPPPASASLFASGAGCRPAFPAPPLRRPRSGPRRGPPFGEVLRAMGMCPAPYSTTPQRKPHICARAPSVGSCQGYGEAIESHDKVRWLRRWRDCPRLALASATIVGGSRRPPTFV